MARICRYSGAIVAALFGLAAPAFAPALAQFRTDLYEHPTLAIDPDMHTAKIRAQAVDAGGRFAVTVGDDRTVRIWSVADGKLLRTISIPIGPEKVGDLNAVAISPDGSTIAAGGWTETLLGDGPIYLFDRESGNLIRRIDDDLPSVTFFLTFSPDGRYLAATLARGNGLRVFDRDHDWSEAFRDDQYEAFRGDHFEHDDSYGAAFTRDGRLATTSFDRRIQLYRYDPANTSPNFRRVGEPVKAPAGVLHTELFLVRTANGWRSAIKASRRSIFWTEPLSNALADKTRPTFFLLRCLAHLFHGLRRPDVLRDGAVADARRRSFLFAWDQGGLGDEQRMPYCELPVPPLASMFCRTD